MSRKNIVRALAVLILFSALFAFETNWYFITNWTEFGNLVGQIQALTTLPYWATIAGAGLLVAGRSIGFWLVLAGTILMITGQMFSYIPFVRWFAWGPLVGLIAMLIANFVVVGLIWYFVRENGDETTI